MPAPLISFGGIASGLDTQSIIAALSSINQKPIGLLEKKKAEFNSLKKRYDELESKLENLRDKARELAKSKNLLAFDAKSSNETVLTASANGDAGVGAFNVTVTSLARAQVNASNGYADLDTTSAGTGDIKITSGGTLHTISIASGQDTLEKIRDKINNADTGVTATIVSTGNGATPYQIVLQSDETGTDQAFTVDLTSFTGSLAFTNQQAAQNASVTLNGMTFSRQSNTIDDIVPGVTLDLISTNAAPVSVSVSPDFDDIAKRIEEYTAAHSDVVNFINSNIKTVNEKGGPFNGESTVRGIKNRLLSALGDGGYPGGSLKSLASIGVKLQNDGTLTFDSEKFKDVALDSLDDVTKLMTKIGNKFDTAGYSLVSKPPNAPAGDHAVVITQIATKASGVAGNAFASGGALNADETLTFTIGEKTVVVALANGDDIAAAVTKINNTFNNANIDLQASDDAGNLKFSALEFGSKGTFSVVSDQPAGMGSTGVDFGGVTGSGLNAAGTIGGVALVGDGQTLKGAKDSVYKGLTFKFSGTTNMTSTLTLGPEGFFVKLEDTLDEFLSAISGPVAARVDGLDDRMNDIDDRIEALADRAERFEDIMRRRFTALEEIMGRFQAQQNFLSTFSFPTPFKK
jgi:flagellar hook-associated protein 2